MRSRSKKVVGHLVEESNIGMFGCVHTSKLPSAVLSHVRTCIILKKTTHQGGILQSHENAKQTQRRRRKNSPNAISDLLGRSVRGRHASKVFGISITTRYHSPSPYQNIAQEVYSLIVLKEITFFT